MEKKQPEPQAKVKEIKEYDDLIEAMKYIKNAYSSEAYRKYMIGKEDKNDE